MKGTCRDLGENLRERDHLEDLGVDGKTIFKWILLNREGAGLGQVPGRCKNVKTLGIHKVQLRKMLVLMEGFCTREFR